MKTLCSPAAWKCVPYGGQRRTSEGTSARSLRASPLARETGPGCFNVPADVLEYIAPELCLTPRSAKRPPAGRRGGHVSLRAGHLVAGGGGARSCPLERPRCSTSVMTCNVKPPISSGRPSVLCAEDRNLLPFWCPVKRRIVDLCEGLLPSSQSPLCSSCPGVVASPMARHSRLQTARRRSPSSRRRLPRRNRPRRRRRRQRQSLSGRRQM
jgi:hypothetical protein